MSTQMDEFLNEKELSDFPTTLEEIEEYESKTLESSSITQLDVSASHFVPIIIKTKSSSGIFSTDYSFHPSSDSMKSIYPPASWPTNESKSDIYLQSSDIPRQDDIFYPELHSSPLNMEQKRLFTSRKISKGERKCVCLKKNLKKIDSKPVIRTSKNRFAKIPFLHEILETALRQKPASKMHYFERLKVSYKANKILSESYFDQAVKIIIPYDGFAGEFTLNVEDTSNGISVDSCSSFKADDLIRKINLFSKLTKEFKLMEEKRIEIEYNNYKRKEKSLHVFVEYENYIAYISSKCNEGINKYRGSISLNFQDDFILDGIVFALMKHLVTIKYSGCFQCYSIGILGKVLRQVFCLGETKCIQINQNMIEVIVLTKSTYEYNTDKKIEMSTTYFLPTGSMIYHTWRYSPYIIHMDPLLLSQSTTLNPLMALTWKSDCMLYIMFEFGKEHLHCRLKKYLDGFPEVVELLYDYIISLFHEKPTSVMDFTYAFLTKQ